MTKVRRILVWLSRWNHCLGFGIQSPWAYSLDRNVLNEHFPYYAYDDMIKKYPDIDFETRKLCELYFRLANYRQPHEVWSYIPQSDAYADYLKCGCAVASVHEVNHPLSHEGTVDMALMSLSGDSKAFYESVIARSDENTVLIVEGIAKNRSSKMFWKMIVADSRTGVTFDLYDCGLVFFDKKRFKENYIINF